MGKQTTVAKSLFERKNLVVLMYSDNTCYTTLVEADDPSVIKAQVTIDHEKGTWQSPGGSVWWSGGRTYKMGETRHCEHGSRWGVISVYDRNNLQHLSSMISAAREATADRNRHSDD